MIYNYMDNFLVLRSNKDYVENDCILKFVDDVKSKDEFIKVIEKYEGEYFWERSIYPKPKAYNKNEHKMYAFLDDNDNTYWYLMTNKYDDILIDIVELSCAAYISEGIVYMKKYNETCFNIVDEIETRTEIINYIIKKHKK